MKKWEQKLVFGIFAIVIGMIVSAWDCQAINPIEIKQIGGQISRATLNTTFLGLLLTGFVLIGGGIGEASCSYTIYKLEKQLAQEHLPFSSPETKKFCRYCGTENKERARTGIIPVGITYCTTQGDCNLRGK